MKNPVGNKMDISTFFQEQKWKCSIPIRIVDFLLVTMRILFPAGLSISTIIFNWAFSHPFVGRNDIPTAQEKKKDDLS